MAPDILVARQGETLDALLWRERALPADALGPVLALNPGLADVGAVLPLGARVAVPAARPAATARAIVQLWD